MNGLMILIPVALFLGAVGLAAFLWSLRAGQFDDVDGAAVRILMDNNEPGEPSGRSEIARGQATPAPAASESSRA
ncbi:MAG TPA: cbb3-type cytochrome oxidase assembly protein CcoS [Bauldia sp.]|nr:cbb3-type cytochrome oxidase assembly protein CcoS [Bauldia sp.]